MNESNQSHETIVAIATPPGYGGVGVVRLSGPKAYFISEQLTHTPLTPRYAKLCQLKDSAGGLLDTALVLYFPAPHSFTGDDVIEFQCHGSPVMLDLIVAQCIEYGARLARAGEFSLTAFLNGKIDLVQAEAIADLIHASSAASVRMAQNSLSGVFSKQIHTLEEALIKLRVLVEAGIDFPDEEVDFISQGKVESKTLTLLDTLNTLMQHAKQGALMREGIRVVIAGQPNAGKSTLMNQLAGREVAIVTPIAGTTRDVMRESILIEGIPLVLIDTAGLRNTTCEVEQEGIKRAKNAITEADLLLWLVDVQDSNSATELHDAVTADLPPDISILKVYNKVDCVDSTFQRQETDLYIAATTGEGLETLRQAILTRVGYHPNEGLFIARRRHLAALERAKTALLECLHQLKTSQALEFIAEELRQAQLALSEITGEFSSDDLLGKIFSTFCIGK